MDFGFKLSNKKSGLLINFEEGIANWKRYVSEMIKDKVILDLKSAKDFLDKNGDMIVYELYNLWKSVKDVKKVYRSTGITCDVTCLNFGLFSNYNKGELFSTYGHAHEKDYGEVFKVIKNECFIVLADRKTYETYIAHLKEKDVIFIHPRFIHRLVSYKRDSIIINFVPKEAGHNYIIVKNKGFPFHLFYDKKKKKLEIKHNRKYSTKKYKILKRRKRSLDPMKLFEKNPEKLKDILENPEKYRKLYFIKN